ncbi:hypothetical protein BGZ96_001622 [Linnemannia gamsii]|uniref:High-temperature-induced dauer-formation protein n=1 Tax=Linnemannia gamsii TaxID=64522 RepID=A0ABQ7JN12_9FUNG|nr:hypothetical protein BGZ96_001622 [Linnemannia gamsii]
MGAADSKLAFKKSVFRLFEERNIPSNSNDYWEQFWTLPESADDVFLIVGSQDIRRVRDEARENLECLIQKILSRLFMLCESPQFLTSEVPVSQLLNCVRVLTRLFPFVFESDDLMMWEERYFWTPRGSATLHRWHSNPGHPNEPTQPSGAEDQSLNSTALDSERISSAPKEQYFNHDRETGIGSSKPIGTSKELDDNRTEILRLLLVLFSRSMYIPLTAITTTENRWIDTVVTGSDRQITLAILCSLVNSALKYNPSGWGLPYNHVMFNDQRELLVMLCLQVIVVLLDYQVIERPTTPPSRFSAGIRIEGGVGDSHNQVSSSSDSPSSIPVSNTNTIPSDQQAQRTLEVAHKNLFRFYLSRLHREQDFLFLTDGMYRILSNPMAASSTYLPGSTKQVKCHIETLMFCWKTLEVNKRFRVYLLETNRVLDFVVILLYFSLEHKLDPTHVGLVRMCASMLQTLSKDKAFGYTLNRPFDGHASLPASVRIHNFHGTYGDYLICSIQHLIATTKRTLRSLYPALISTLSNVSPYIQNISPLASSRLLQLTTSFASPSFLLAEESNHRLLGILLDTVTSILYYQATHNPHLVYALVQYEPKIQTMARFTLQRGLDDIHKLRYRSEDSSSAAHSTTSAEGHMPKSTEGRRRQSRGSGSQSHQGSHGECTPPPSQQVPRRPQLLKRDSSSVEDTSTSNVPLSSSGSIFNASTTTFSPALTVAAMSNPNTLPLSLSPVIPPLFRPDSSDSIMAPSSDGGGHEGDVEDEGGPSTVLKNPKDRSIDTLSERARGKLPEKNHHHYQPNSPAILREDSSCELERQEVSVVKEEQSSSSLKAAGRISGSATKALRSPTLTIHSLSYRHERPTTASDVGQNGFVPTDEWVQGWMRTLRFEPLLIMLQCVIPEIESIQAMNDQQVLEFIRTNIIPMLQQVLPESGRPPIIIHKFTWTGSGNIDNNNNINSGGDDDLTLVWWFQGMLWSQIYVGGCGSLGRQGLGAWYETGVRMFSIRTLTSSSTSSMTVVAVTENMSTVAAAAIKAAGSTFATGSLGSGTGSSPNHRTFAAAMSGAGAGSGTAGKRTSGQSNSSSSTLRPPSSSTVTTSTGPDASPARDASRKSSSGSISKDAVRNV